MRRVKKYTNGINRPREVIPMTSRYEVGGVLGEPVFLPNLFGTQSPLLDIALYLENNPICNLSLLVEKGQV